MAEKQHVDEDEAKEQPRSDECMERLLQIVCAAHDAHGAWCDVPPDVLAPEVVDAVQAARDARGPHGTKGENEGHRCLVAAVRTVWMSLSRLGDSHPLRLPPLYTEAKAVHICLSAVVRLLDKIEKAESGGSIIVQGVVGVGKSTILRATQIVGVLVFDVLCPLWDCSREGGGFDTPLCVLRDAVAAVIEDTPTLPTAEEVNGATRRAEVMYGALRQLRKNGWRGPLLLADEINALYRADAPEACLHAVAELLCIAKTEMLGAAVLTGSSAKLRHMAFCGGEWKHRGYPSLNRSVYGIYHISPVRDPDALTEYFELRYPGTAVPRDLLYYTGGVGRDVEALVTHGNEELEASVRQHVERSFHEHPNFARVAVAFLRKYRGEVKKEEVPFVKTSAVTSLGLTNADVDDLVDESLLLRVDDRVELLHPAALPVLRDSLGRSDEARRDFVLRACFAYFDQDQYRDAEPYVLDAVGRRLDVAHHRLKVRCVEGEYKAETSPGVWEPLGRGALDLDALCNQLIQVAKETGIDGFYITREEAGVYCVHLVQIKLGQWNRIRDDPGKITAGCLLAMRESAWECLHRSDAADRDACPDCDAGPDGAGWHVPRLRGVKGNTIAAVVAKLEVGVDGLLTLLKTAFPSSDARPVAWRVRGVHLVTSKRVTAAAKAAARRVKLCDKDARVHEHPGVPAANPEARCSVTISVIEHEELFDPDMMGTEWV